MDGLPFQFLLLKLVNGGLILKRRSVSREKRAMSSLIAEVMLVACAITIGIVVWSFAVSYSNVEMTSYWQKVSKNIYGLKERFTVERVAFNFTGDSSGTLHIWVFNYGEIDIEAKIYVLRDGSVMNETSSYTKITKGNMAEFTLNLGEVSSGNELIIKVESLRGNANLDSYKVY